MPEQSELKKIGDVVRPQSLSQNRNKEGNNEYTFGSPDLISDIDNKGKDTNPVTGSVGSFDDRVQRTKLKNMNKYKPGLREYDYLVD